MENGYGPWGPKKSNNGPNSEDFLSDIRNLFKKWKESYSSSTIFSGNNNNKAQFRFLIGLLSIFCLVWLATGFYRVQLSEKGVVLRFGRLSRISEPGLNYHLPYPIEKVLIKDVTAVNRIDSVSFSSNKDNMSFSAANNRDRDRDRDKDRDRDRDKDSDSNLMLTGDENIVDVNFTVFWVIKDIEQYLFNVKSPDATVHAAAESVVREVLAQTPMASALTEGRSTINHLVQEKLQALIDYYKIGVSVNVQMGRIDPPKPVIDSYRAVQRARSEQEQQKNEAEAHKESIIPVAIGDAEAIIRRAEANKEKFIKEAAGNAERVKLLAVEYEKHPSLTYKRLYFETIANILQKADKVEKVIVDNKNLLTYFPLPQASQNSK